MKKILLSLSLFFVSTILFAQCVSNVDFNQGWQVAENPPQGSWSVQGGGSYVSQSVNGNPTFFISPFDLMNVHLSGEFRTTDLDDDWMGFVWSYITPINAPASNVECWLFDWKEKDQDNSPQGMSVNKLDGTLAGTPGAQFKDHISAPGFTVVANNFGSGGWNRGNWHRFDLFLTYTRAIIYIDGVQKFDITDCFKPGRFGFYNLSQEDCDYRNFQYELFVDFNFSKDKICVGDTTVNQFVTACATTFNPYRKITWVFGDGTQDVNNNPTLLNVNKPHAYAAPGIYKVTLIVEDIAGCVDSAWRDIEVRDSIKLNPTIVEPLCNGAANGTITPNATGGYGSYSHFWNGGPGTQTLTYVGAAAGTYNLSVTDGYCSQTATFTLDQPTALTATTSHTDANCGQNNGPASITISGGTPPYQGVSWAGIAATNSGGVWTTTGLWAANHIADFQDANGCSALLQYTEQVKQLPCGLTTTLTSTNIKCFGGTDGSARLVVLLNGGPAPGTITWTPGGQTGPDLTNVVAGTYTYTYTEAGNPGNNFNGTVTITQPPTAMTVNLTTIGISCAGQADGVALASVTAGGTSPYTYTWSGGLPNSPSHQGLATGPVSVVVTDANGCTGSASGNIGNAPPIVIDIAVTDDICYFATGGSAIAHISGGSYPYTYEWSNFVTDTANVNINQGTYTITVTDVKGCTATASATVGGPTLLTKTKALTHVNCTGDSTGSVVINATGGTGSYTYTWNPPVSTASSATNLVAGVYRSTVTDANGCQTFSTDTILQPDSALYAISSHTNVTCNGANDGSITITVGGGSPPYSYQGSTIPGPVTTTVYSLPGGIYGGVLTDSLGCSVTLSDTITEPGPQSLSITKVDNTCAGGVAGSIDAVFVNATGNVTYNWNPGGVLPSPQTGLAAGIYDITATDDNNCTVSATTTITEPPIETLPVTTTDAPCFGANGSATANPATGTAPYNYVWSITTAGSGASITPPAGSYSVTSTDVNSCIQTATFTINEPPAQQLTVTATDAPCFGSTGTATATPNGGNPPFTYAWSATTDVTQTINSPAGTYTVTGTDALGCGQTGTYTVNAPPAIVVTEQHTDVLCFGNTTGSITLTTTGGAGGNYAYAWSPNVSSSQTASGLAAGDYNITVTDDSACTTVTLVTITQPAQLDVTGTTTPALCFGDNTGAMQVQGSGGTAPYAYTAIGSTGNPLSSSTGQFSGIMAGDYTVLVTDNNQCVDSTVITVASPPEITNSLTVTDITCKDKADGQILSVAAGGSGSGYVYSLSNGTQNSNGLFTGLDAGTYIVIVADGNNCTTSDTAVLTDPDNYAITVTPENATVNLGQTQQLQATVNYTGGVSYEWEPATGLSCYDCDNPVFEGNQTLTYQVVATTDAGCQLTSGVTITVIPDYGFFLPNVFTPNADGQNDIWGIFVKSSNIKQVNIKVFNRIGELVFETNDMNVGWDGTYKGEPAPAGVYTYLAKFVWMDNHSDNNFHGTITLLR